MNETKKNELTKLATNVRKSVVEEVYAAQSGHPGGALSATDILTYLYSEVLNIDPKNPRWEDRDRCVLSKGHSCPALYAILAEKGYFDKAALKTFRKPGSFLQGHTDLNKTPGVDYSAGSLGLGVSSAAGMALAGKLKNKSYRVFAILGDGEIQEGQVWESAMFSAHYKLDNLVYIIDNNNLQIDGTVEEVCSPYPIKDKFEAFGFEVFCIDGHNFDEIEAAVQKAIAVKGKPAAIIAKTVKGKGVSYMENNVDWHGSAPKTEQYEIAMADLNKILAEVQ